MKHQFGWDLPPGVTHGMIEEHAGAFEKEYPWSLTIWPKHEGFGISIYNDIPYAPNYNLPTEMNEPDYYFVANVEELLEFLKGIYDKQQ